MIDNSKATLPVYSLHHSSNVAKINTTPLEMLKRRLKRPKGVLNIRKMCAQRWQLHTLQEFMKELVRRVRIGIIAHKDTHSRVIEYGIAFIGIAIIEDDAEQ